MSRKWRAPATVTFEPGELSVLLMLLTERINKCEKQRLQAEAGGWEFHPVARRSLKRAHAAREKIQAAMNANRNPRTEGGRP